MKKQTFIIVNDDVKDRAAKAVLSLCGDGTMCVEIKPYKKKRTLSQNAAFHGVWIPAIAEFCGMDDESVKVELKEKFAPYVSYTGLDGVEYVRKKGTSEMTTKEFTDFVEKIHGWCASYLQFTLPPLNYK